MTGRKAFLLRMDPALWTALEGLAQRELRSVNAQIEFLLRDSLAKRGAAPRPPSPGDKDDAGGEDE
jgi:hypothetical protein